MSKLLETYGNKAMNLDGMLATNIQSLGYFRDLYFEALQNKTKQTKSS
ncbi:hypothetical protein DFA_03101 [Cavenderia fasciculata]|uniref:Uncharacterized protein n=1 Tax=Cavenderia fasciculata TaxID=261658 RepID=F4PGM2_CACFS|nr:uncharacterized protein DFA_03101 [Cavenderia fasciculata]EGG24856.1 hypothetical protein DFA_03101 [Cavenderia fasciculata]|eukprot:XP_004362707.1 hypothetical protein DFA_03101 [Cavenderia fasciculata]